MSPVNSFSIVVRYCCGSESSKPHSSRIASTWVSVGCLPAIRCAGSPFGSTLKIRKTSTETANITNTIEISRLTMNRAISAPA